MHQAKNNMLMVPLALEARTTRASQDNASLHQSRLGFESVEFFCNESESLESSGMEGEYDRRGIGA